MEVATQRCGLFQLEGELIPRTTKEVGACPLCGRQVYPFTITADVDTLAQKLR